VSRRRGTSWAAEAGRVRPGSGVPRASCRGAVREIDDSTPEGLEGRVSVCGGAGTVDQGR